MKAILNFKKPYEEQTLAARRCISETDFYTVAKVLGYNLEIKKIMKKRVDKPKKAWYNKEKRERGVTNVREFNLSCKGRKS